MLTLEAAGIYVGEMDNIMGDAIMQRSMESFSDNGVNSTSKYWGVKVNGEQKAKAKLPANILAFYYSLQLFKCEIGTVIFF